MLDKQLSTSVILSRTFVLVGENARSAILWGLLLAAAAAAMDMLARSGSSSGGNAVVGIVGIVVQNKITADLLRQEALLADGARQTRFWAMFGLSLVTNLAIIFGAVLLIVPGLFLAVRWSVAVPVLIGEEAGVFDSMQRSWALTKGHFWPILGALAVIYLGLLVGVALAIFFELAGSQPLIAAIVTNAVIYAVIVVGWHAAVAIYGFLHTDGARLAEVFE